MIFNDLVADLAPGSSKFLFFIKTYHFRSSRCRFEPCGLQGFIFVYQNQSFSILSLQILALRTPGFHLLPKLIICDDLVADLGPGTSRFYSLSKRIIFDALVADLGPGSSKALSVIKTYHFRSSRCRFGLWISQEFRRNVLGFPRSS